MNNELVNSVAKPSINNKQDAYYNLGMRFLYTTLKWL